MAVKSITRQEEILLNLSRFDYLTVKQIQRLHDLKSDPNAYRVVGQLKPYVNVFKDNGTNVYYLNKKGRGVVDCHKKRTKLTTVKHYLMRNDLYIYLQCPGSWKNEVKITLDDITIVADAHFKSNRHYLVEIDNMQKMRKNRQKIDKYRRLVEKGAFDGMPGLMWVTTTPYRQKVLREICEGLDTLILLDSDLK